MADERKKELEEILNNVCREYEDDCSKCPCQKEYNKYTHLENK